MATVVIQPQVLALAQAMANYANNRIAFYDDFFADGTTPQAVKTALNTKVAAQLTTYQTQLTAIISAVNANT